MENLGVKLYEAGTSIWYDNIERKLLLDGTLKKLIDDEIVRGVTSNPSIFNLAISKSTEYENDIRELARAGKTTREVYDALTIADIQDTADLLRVAYMFNWKKDGYVSLEVAPDLAYDTQGTIEDAKRLWNLVDRENLMIKIPATKPGLKAITEAIRAGINVNVTLIFSLDRYREVMHAYAEGLRLRLDDGNKIDDVASVASFFVSRVDSKVDKYLSGKPQADILKGKAAVANAKLAYQEFLKFIGTDAWKSLEARGAKVQRPLWASTSTKNPDYRDVIYVEELIGPNTVNTVPPSTLTAFLEHGEIRPSLLENVETARAVLSDLEASGISMRQVTDELESEGVVAFQKAFLDLLASIDERRTIAREQLGDLSLASDVVKKKLNQ